MRRLENEMAGADTISKILAENCRKWGDRKVAIRRKDFGIWQEYTWKDSYETIRYLALGLMTLGFERGDKLTILGDNDPEWYWLEWAAHAVGGAAVGVFVDCALEEVKYIVAHSDSKMVGAGDQEQVDKLLTIKDELPNVKKVIYWDKKGMHQYDASILVSFDELIELGRVREESHPGAFETEVEKGRGEDVAAICYTSGTTGLPKGAMVSHRTLIDAVQAANYRLKWTDADDYVAFAPPAWILDQGNAIAGSPITGMVLNFAEEPETTQEDIREISPRCLLYGSRQWEGLASEAQVKMSDAPFIKRFTYHLFLPVGYKIADSFYQRKELNLFWKGLHKLADWTVFRALRDKMGLTKATCALAGGTYVGPDTFRYFNSIGINIRNMYGSTETTYVSMQSDDDVKLGSAGTPSPGKEVRIEEDEIIVRGMAIFSGYYKNPEATKESMAGGWFHMGDAGYIDEDAHLYFIERVKDLITLSGGARFSPTYIESQLKFSPYIRDAMVVGDESKPFVACIVNIDYEAVGKWAERHRIPYTTFADLSQKPQVCELVKGEVDRVNKSVSPEARIKRFVNLYKEFDPDEAELTRTRKLRRSFMADRYKLLIDSIYQDKEEVRIETDVKYRDGRMGRISTPVRIVLTGERR